MGVAVSDEQAELARVVRAFLARHGAREAARAALDGGSAVPHFWKDMAGLGWFGLHVPERNGGAGFGVAELAVVAEELGRECTPGPFLPTVVCAGALAASGLGGNAGTLLADLVAGDRFAGIGLDGALRADDDGRLNGDAGIVLFAEDADVLALAVREDLVIVGRDTPGVSIEARANLDPTRPCAKVACADVDPAGVLVLRGAVASTRTLLRVLIAAEAAGGAAMCRETAVEHAKTRVAFGHPIGQFQAVKHHCANMLADEETAGALAWRAARAYHLGDGLSLFAEAACAHGLTAFMRAAKLGIQVHGGIGYTWEHDAHLFLRRASASAAFAGPVDEAYSAVARLNTVPRESAELELPPEAEEVRGEVRRFVESYKAAPTARRHSLLVEEGYLFPHWPKPWGRGAGPVEQLVIDQEFGPVDRLTALGPTWWSVPIVLPAIITHGTADQQERWVLPTLHGELRWCQLYSEPGAGSDLASLATRATRTGGGWRVNGQKVWTSNAQDAAVGFALVRTDQDAPKHRGISCFVIDMKAPGVTVRPLRDITGRARFNEVFLDHVFVPDEDVVGEVNRGWRLARTTLDSERVTISESSTAGGSLWSELDERSWNVVRRTPSLLVDLGRLRTADLALSALALRAAARAVAGTSSGIEAGLAKLLAAEGVQAFADFRLRLAEREGVFHGPDPDDAAGRFLLMRQMTIMGGTSEILRNTIAERALGLPRDATAR